MSINIPRPDLQADFAASLIRLRETCLLQALRKAAGEVDIAALDAELARLAPKAGLARLAAEYADFKARILGLAGIAASRSVKKQRKGKDV